MIIYICRDNISSSFLIPHKKNHLDVIPMIIISKRNHDQTLWSTKIVSLHLVSPSQRVHLFFNKVYPIMLLAHAVLFKFKNKCRLCSLVIFLIVFVPTARVAHDI